MNALLRIYYLTHPRAAIRYAKVQTRLFGLTWVFNRRRWNGAPTS